MSERQLQFPATGKDSHSNQIGNNPQPADTAGIQDYNEIVNSLLYTSVEYKSKHTNSPKRLPFKPRRASRKPVTEEENDPNKHPKEGEWGSGELAESECNTWWNWIVNLDSENPRAGAQAEVGSSPDRMREPHFSGFDDESLPNAKEENKKEEEQYEDVCVGEENFQAEDLLVDSDRVYTKISEITKTNKE